MQPSPNIFLGDIIPSTVITQIVPEMMIILIKGSIFVASGGLCWVQQYQERRKWNQERVVREFVGSVESGSVVEILFLGCFCYWGQRFGS